MSLAPTFDAPPPRWARARSALPAITALWMERAGERLARIELRIERPSAAPDWVIRRIEWLQPIGAALAARPEDRARRMVDVALRPRQSDGRWFEGDPSLWVRYVDETVAAHNAALRLDLERPGGRWTSLDVAAAFPALAPPAQILLFEPRAPRLSLA